VSAPLAKHNKNLHYTQARASLMLARPHPDHSKSKGIFFNASIDSIKIKLEKDQNKREIGFS